MSQSLSVPSRFNGPLESGQGGYVSGLLAGFLEGAAEVTLRRPVPLDTRLDVVRQDDGAVRALAGEELVAEAKAVAELGLEVPPPVSPQDARGAKARYGGRADGVFSRCFVCGRARDDSFEVFAGPVEGREVVASPWTPPRGRRTRTATCFPSACGLPWTAPPTSPCTRAGSCR